MREGGRDEGREGGRDEGREGGREGSEKVNGGGRPGRKKSVVNRSDRGEQGG